MSNWSQDVLNDVLITIWTRSMTYKEAKAMLSIPKTTLNDDWW